MIDSLETRIETQVFATIFRPLWAKQADRRHRKALVVEEAVG
ncbi:MAG: hypothetical protein ACL7BU_15790 [Candidatus Phlomobacter fragariae]